MAIKNLTDRKTLKPALPRIGKLRKGGEKTNPKKPGPDLDHFRFTSDDPAIVAAFHESYGDKPRLINAVVFHETTEEAFPSWIEAWDASGLVFRSDGDNWIIWRDGSTYKQGTKPHVDHPDQIQVGRLEVLIPELLQQGFVGTVTLETHGNHDLRNITSVLYAAERERGGNLRGAQFVIRRIEEEISVPGWGDRSDKRSKAKKWLVKLETPRRLFDNLLTSGGESQKQIAAPSAEWNDAAFTAGEVAEAETTFDDLPPAPRQSSPKVEPKPAAKPQQKATPPSKPSWPTSGPVADFCNEVRKATDHYTSSYHLSNAIGGFGDLSKPEVFAAKLSEAVDRVNIPQSGSEAETAALFDMTETSYE